MTQAASSPEMGQEEPTDAVQILLTDLGNGKVDVKAGGTGDYLKILAMLHTAQGAVLAKLKAVAAPVEPRHPRLFIPAHLARQGRG